VPYLLVVDAICEIVKLLGRTTVTTEFAGFVSMVAVLATETKKATNSKAEMLDGSLFRRNNSELFFFKISQNDFKIYNSTKIVWSKKDTKERLFSSYKILLLSEHL
jgi:hypothetical protein